jgi:hypothetical protein
MWDEPQQDIMLPGWQELSVPGCQAAKVGPSSRNACVTPFVWLVELRLEEERLRSMESESS